MSAVSRPISQSISHSQKQKPVEWIASLIQRYQDQLPTRTGKTLDRECRELLNTTHSCIVNVSKHHLHLVVHALVRALKAVNASKWTSHITLSQSRLVILETLLECLHEAQPIPGRNMEREACMKAVLDEMWLIISAVPSAARDKAIAVVSRVGDLAASVLIARAERALSTMQDDEASEDAISHALSHITLMSYGTLELDVLVKFIQMVTSCWPPRKEHLESVCSMISSVIWKWIERYPEHFSTLQHSPQEHITEVMDTLFMAMNTADLRRRAICWPVQMMLIAVSPCSLEAIAHADQEGVNLPEAIVLKRQFVDQVTWCVQSAGTGAAGGSSRSPSSAQLHAACHAAVHLCKSATYVNLSDFFVFNVVQQLVEHVKVVLLTGARPREMERSVLVDCFVALFRLKFDNDVFRVCLSSSQPLLQLVLVEALTIIASQHRLHWWPRIDMLMSRSEQLRTLLLAVLDKVVEAEQPPAAHLPLGVSRVGIVTAESWQKVSGRWRVERPSSGSVGSAPSSGDATTHHTILVAIIRLITTQPTLLIRNKSEETCIESVVASLVLLIDHPSLATHSMQALLALHRVIPEWNCLSPSAALTTFFSVSSHMMFSVCQKLIHLQIAHAESVIHWLKAIVKKRNDYLRENADVITTEMVDGITAQSIVKFEVVCFLYLWSCSSELVLCCVSLFSLHSRQCSRLHLQLPTDSAVLSRIISSQPAAAICTAGRIALQKSVYRIIRGLPHSNAASSEAWHETFRVWELFTNQLVQGCKDHSDFVDHVARVTTDSSDAHALVETWSSMSGFLCAFSHLIAVKEPNHVSTYLTRLLTVLRMEESQPGRDVMCKCVKELCSYEIDSSLDQQLLQSISSLLAVNASHSSFVEHVIYILKNILGRRQSLVLRVDSTSQMLSALLHSQGAPDRSAAHKLTYTRKLCSLLQVVVSNGSARRLPSSLQSRMLESLSACVSTLPPPSPFSPTRADLLLPVLGALTRLLSNISIPVPAAIFNKLLSELMDSFQECSLSRSSPLLSRNPLEDMANSSVAGELSRKCNDAVLGALAALINANAELGIPRVLEIAWNGEWKARGWLLATLCRLLSEHAPNSAASPIDRQGALVEMLRLLPSKADDGSLPLVSALANSLPSDSTERLCHMLVAAFSERDELDSLLWSVLWQEAESALSPSTLFRGSTFAARLISCSLRIFGHSYLLRTLRPLLEQQTSNGNPLLEGGEESLSLTMEGAELAFDLIISSLPLCPHRFRVICRHIYNVINGRFPGIGLSALGKILFLRFFNPAIVSPFELQVWNRRPSPVVSRRLTLVSKILQTAANRPSTCRDPCLSPFIPLINQRSDALNQFLGELVEEVPCEELPQLTVPPSANIPLMLNLHSLFASDQAELLRQLRFTSSGAALFSRVDAVLKSLPADVPLPPTPAETLDPSLPFFIQLSTGSPPVFAIILRRLQNVELENAAKQISEKCGRSKWICLLDGLSCYDPPNLMKLFSADSFAHIHRILVLHCSTQLFNKLNDNFSLLQTLDIHFDPASLRIPFDSLPFLSRAILSEPTHSFSATLITTQDIAVTVKLMDNMLIISGERGWGESPALVTDFFQCTDFDQMELLWPDVVTLVQGENLISLQCDAPSLLSHICSERTRVSRQESGGVLAPLRAHSLQLLSLAFVHLADSDISVRSTAYRLLSSLAATLQLPAFTSLQESPCVFVPSACCRFLSSTAVCLVNAEHDLLGVLVPRLLEPSSVSLMASLCECWSSVALLREETRSELFGALTSATAAGGPVAAALCDGVWPKIGKLDDVTLHTLLTRLQLSCPLSAALSVVQSVSAGGDGLAALIMEAALAQLHSSPSSSASPSLLSRLLAFLLVLTFDTTSQFLDAQLANLMHIVVCVAGNGSAFQRAATFALVSNVFHSFGSNPSLHLSDELRRSLSLFVRQLCSEEAMRLFRISGLECGQNVVHFAMQYIDSDTRSDRDGEEYDRDDDSLSSNSATASASSSSPHADLHQILNLIIALVQDLQAGLPSPRDWLSDWRSLARQWAFAGTGEVQIRSLIAYSCLADTISDQEVKAVVQLLVQVVKRRESVSAVAGVSLSLIRLHTLTASNSPVHRLVFWVCVVLFQLENATIYEHVVLLLHANISNLDHMGVFEHTSLERLAMDARTPLEWDLKALDQCAGLSFRANFNFALVGYLLKGLRQPTLSLKVIQLLQLLLKISAKSNQHNPYVLTTENVPFLLALLPFDDKMQTRFRLTWAVESGGTATRAVLSAPWSTFEDPTEETPRDGDERRENGRLSSQRENTASASLLPSSLSSNAVTTSQIGWGEEEEEESGPLLDPSIISGEQTQALAVTVLAILARSCPNVHIILDYLLEAVSVFPAVVPVVECLLDQRIVGLVQSCQSPRMLSTVVRLIESSASGDAGGPQQAVFFLQQCGFAGLWRYAGAFLSPRASLQAINANLCSCLECILASL